MLFNVEVWSSLENRNTGGQIHHSILDRDILDGNWTSEQYRAKKWNENGFSGGRLRSVCWANLGETDLLLLFTSGLFMFFSCENVESLFYTTQF